MCGGKPHYGWKLCLNSVLLCLYAMKQVICNAMFLVCTVTGRCVYVCDSFAILVYLCLSLFEQWCTVRSR
jgi:hypothetical protein